MAFQVSLSVLVQEKRHKLYPVSTSIGVAIQAQGLR